MDSPTIPQHRPKKVHNASESESESPIAVESTIAATPASQVGDDVASTVGLDESEEEEEKEDVIPVSAPVLPSTRPLSSKSTQVTELPQIPLSRPKATGESPVPDIPSRPSSRPSRKVSSETPKDAEEPTLEPATKSPEEEVSTDILNDKDAEIEGFVDVADPESSTDNEEKIDTDGKDKPSEVVEKDISTMAEEQKSSIPLVPSRRPQKVVPKVPEAEDVSESEAKKAVQDQPEADISLKEPEDKPQQTNLEDREKPEVNDDNESGKDEEKEKKEQDEGENEESKEPVVKKQQEEDSEPESYIEKEVDPFTKPLHPVIPPSRPSKRPIPTPLKTSSQVSRESSLSTPVYEQVIDIYNSESPDVQKTRQNSIKEGDSLSSKPPISLIDFNKSTSSESTESKKPPPRVPKKPSSKIAAFQQMLADRQKEDANMFLPRPIAPKTRPKVAKSVEGESSESNPEDLSKDMDAEEKSHRPLPNKLGTSQFARNLNGMIGFALPGMALPGALPPFAKSSTSTGDDDEGKQPESEANVNTDVRKSRARGPRGKRLPGNVKDKLVINDETLGNIKKFTIRTADVWSFGIPPESEHIESEAEKENPEEAVIVADEDQVTSAEKSTSTSVESENASSLSVKDQSEDNKGDVDNEVPKELATKVKEFETSSITSDKEETTTNIEEEKSESSADIISLEEVEELKSEEKETAGKETFKEPVEESAIEAAKDTKVNLESETESKVEEEKSEKDKEAELGYLDEGSILDEYE